MTTLLRSNASLAWVVLVILAAAAWALGTHGFGGTQEPISLMIIAVAVFKGRLIGLYFMELRNAPRWLRGAFEGYCVVLLVLLSSMFVLA